jgi:uncharacterized membrane protein
MTNVTTGLADDAGTLSQRIALRRITIADLRAALDAGWADFRAIPTQLVFLCLLYPVVGLLAGRAAFNDSLMPLVWPLVAGLSLMGPVCAVGLYEISRRREAGLPASARNALDVLKSPALPQIAAMGALLLGLFLAWLFVADRIWRITLGPMAIGGWSGFRDALFQTHAGTILLVWGNLAGFVFALAVLCLSAVSIPLMLDRHVGLAQAIQVSIRVVRENPVTMAIWGLIVAAILALGCLPLFIGLAVAMPVLGHATWHLYRRAVVR